MLYRDLPLPSTRRSAPAWFRATLALWRRRLATRGVLAGIEAHLLADIGLTEAQRRTECAKPFWR